MEKSEVIVVLDSGKEESGVEPDMFCCFLTFGFYLGW